MMTPSNLIRCLLIPRNLNLIGFIFCAGLLATAYYFEYVMDMQPCPLCMAQRLVIYAVGVVFLAAAIHNPAILGRRIYGSLQALLALGGGGLASRQLWLQNLPADQVPACGPSFDYMVEVLPWRDIVTTMITGSGDCAEVHWTFLGLSIPGWTLVGFCVMLALGLMQWRKQPID